MAKKLLCPKCKSDNVSSERRMNGNHICGDCKHRSKLGTFLTEDMVAGDSGYDPTNIAAGINSGAAVGRTSAASVLLKKKKKKKENTEE